MAAPVGAAILCAIFGGGKTALFSAQFITRDLFTVLGFILVLKQVVGGSNPDVLFEQLIEI